MNAALVTSFDQPPAYRRVPRPEPGQGRYLVDVLAVGLHPRTRSGAEGRHYTSSDRLPLVPGMDGVGRRADGSLVYFVAADDQEGTMAEQALVDPHQAIDLPPDTDVTAVAAAMNPAMSSWVALHKRAPLEAGQSVLVLGATGNAGTMAVQIAKLLGAGRVVGAGRDPERLAALPRAGADAVVALGEDRAATDDALAHAAADVDLVLDYLWGPPAERAIGALVRARTDRSRTLNWIQIGAVAGPTIELPSAYLRSADLRVLGSGQGAVSPAGYRAELPALAAALTSGTIAVQADPRPLAEVTSVWLASPVPGRRTVLIP